MTLMQGIGSGLSIIVNSGSTHLLIDLWRSSEACIDGLVQDCSTLQCVSNGITVVLHEASDIGVCELGHH